jgi:hypothetical protein
MLQFYLVRCSKHGIYYIDYPHDYDDCLICPLYLRSGSVNIKDKLEEALLLLSFILFMMIIAVPLHHREYWKTKKLYKNSVSNSHTATSQNGSTKWRSTTYEDTSHMALSKLKRIQIRRIECFLGGSYNGSW